MRPSTWHSTCKGSSQLPSYLLLRRHWDVGDELLLAILPCSLWATFLIRLQTEQAEPMSGRLANMWLCYEVHCSATV